MKRFIVFLTAIGLVLASCQLPVGGAGTLKVVLPGSVNKATLANSDAVRLQLTRNGVIVPIGGGDFVEKALAGQTISIDGLVPGPGYVLYVSTGHRASGETFYTTDLFQKSSAFEISAGVSTEVTVTLDTSRVRVLEAKAGGHGATVLGGDLYFVAGNGVYQVSDLADLTGVLTTAAFTIPTGPSGLTVNGLSNDGTDLWLNTTKGVAVDNGASFANPLMTDSEGLIFPSVAESGKLSLGAESLSYYFGAGLTAGVELEGDTEWSTMDDLLDFSEDLKDKLNGQIIRGVASTSSFGVLATSIGAFRVIESMLSQEASDLGDDLTEGKHGGVSIEILPSDTSLLIGPVSAIADGTTRFIFGGTTKGLYASPVDAQGIPSAGTLALVPGTLGLNITKLATHPTTIGEFIYTAAYSAGTREVLLLRGTTVIDRVSVFEGLPSGDLRLTLFGSGASLYLVVAGSDATVVVNVPVIVS